MDRRSTPAWISRSSGISLVPESQVVADRALEQADLGVDQRRPS